MGPLDGVRVLDLTRVMAGPYATTILGDYGADVIKVEPPGGDMYRHMGDLEIGGENGPFLIVNHSKRGIVLDLRRDEAKEVASRLAARCDVLVENFRPGTAERLGLGYDHMSAVNPRLIYCSVSGFGPVGPYRDKAGTDPVVQAMSGIMSMTGEPGRPPVVVGPPVGDFNAAILAALAIVMALHARGRTGRGQKIDVSLLDASVFSLGPRVAPYFYSGKVPDPLGSRHPLIAPNEVFATKSLYIHVSVLDDASWRRLCDALGRNDLRDDQGYATNADRLRRRDELFHTLEDTFRMRVAEEWVGSLEAHDVLCAPVYTLDRVFSDPQVKMNEMAVTVHHPTAGDVQVLGLPMKFSDTPGEVTSAAPLLGQHTDEVLREVGYAPDEITTLRASGAVG